MLQIDLPETRVPVSWELVCAVHTLSHLGFDGQLMGHWDYGYRERRSGIVSLANCYFGQPQGM
jgi:hypothetical protein